MHTTMATHELSTDETGFTHLILRNPDGVLVLDSTGVILFVNPAAETMFGRSAAALAGRMFGFPIVLG